MGLWDIGVGLGESLPRDGKVSDSLAHDNQERVLGIKGLVTNYREGGYKTRGGGDM